MELPGSSIEIDKFLGTWYQFASNPQFYEPKGSYNIKAVYARDEAGVIRVTNTLQYRGKNRSITGSLLPTTQPNQFKVKLERAFLWFSITAPYNVETLYADEKGDYIAAIVSGGGSDYILTRTQTLPCDLQYQILARLGADRTRRLDFTSQIC